MMCRWFCPSGLSLGGMRGADQVYNSIRVFITAYVWMTGFGNFSFFYLKVCTTIGMVHVVVPPYDNAGWLMALLCLIPWHGDSLSLFLDLPLFAAGTYYGGP